MSVVSIIGRRPIGSLVVCVCLAALGFLAVVRIPINFLPDTRHPALTVTTELADSDPQEIETLITNKIEESIADLPGLKEVSSTSSEGRSRVVAKFHLGQNISDAGIELRGRLRRLWPTLPNDTRFPILTHYNPSDEPIAVLGVTSPRPLEKLSHWVENTLKPLLSTVDGVATVQLAGAIGQEIKVDCDTDKLQSYSATLHDVISAIETGHSSTTGGFISVGPKRMAVRTVGKFKDVSDVSRQPLLVSKAGGLVTVGDVAKVRLVPEQPETIARLNGQPVISLGIYRSSDADLRQLWRVIKRKIDSVNAANKVDAKVDVVFSQAEHLEDILSRLKILMALAAAAAGIVLLVFLRSLISTITVLISIPFSVLVAVLLLYLCSIPLDIISLTGLSLAIGIVVDNGIVVMEAVSRQLRFPTGNRTEAVVEGAREVALPVLFSTLTTIMVFLPLVLVSARIRNYLSGLTWTVSLSLTASLAAALVLVPAMFQIMERSRRVKSLTVQQEVNHTKTNQTWKKIFLYGAIPLFLAAGVFLAIAVYLAQHLTYRQDWGFSEPGFRITIITPPGTATERTADMVTAAEKVVLETPHIHRVYSRSKKNQGKVMVKMAAGTDSAQTDAVMQSMRNRLRNTRETQYLVLPFRSGANSRSLSVTLFGSTLDGLMTYVVPIYKKLSSVTGIDAVVIHQGNPRKEAQFVINHEVLGASGVSVSVLASDVRERMTGPIAARLFVGEREIQVRARADRDPSEGLKSLQHAFVRAHGDRMIPFAELTQPKLIGVPTEIRHKDRRRVISLTVVYGRDQDPLQLAHAVNDELKGMLLAPGYSFKLGEEVERILEERREMITAGVIALLLIYLVLVAATESFVQPVVIIAAVPFACAGVVYAITALGLSVNLPVYVGLIILCGLVVNVNIVLVYAINDRLRSGLDPEEATLQGTKRRVRPILMTTLTTICASAPMLIDQGAGSATWFPFAVTLASGLTASALFSLILTPAVYLVGSRAKRLLKAI